MSIVTQSVTVRHPRALTPVLIESAINAAGYDILAAPAPEPSSWSGTVLGLSRIVSSKQRTHLDNCAQCRAEQVAMSPLAEKPISDEKVRASLRCVPRPTYDPGQQHETNFIQENVPTSPDRPSVAEGRDAAPHQTSSYQVTLSIGGMTCASCSSTVTSTLSEIPGVSDIAVNLLGNSATLMVTVPEVAPAVISAVEDIGYTAEVISIEPLRPSHTAMNATHLRIQQEGPLRVDLSVGGMTCASCVNTVTALLEDIPGVSEVSVNLIGKSATAIIQGREIAPQIAETINDAGYEAEVVNLKPVHASEQDEMGPRTVALRVDGMYCP